jgi:hypothetical protein
MKSRFKVFSSVVLALAFLLAACGGANPTQQPESGPGGGESNGQEQATVAPTEASHLCAHPYYPGASVGATWTYQVTGDQVQSFTFTDTITDVRADGFTLSSAFDDLNRTQEWSCSSAGLAALQFGGGAAANLSGNNIQANFTTTNASGITLPADLAAGSTWTQSLDIEGDMTVEGGISASAAGTVDYDAEAIGMETISVPAGTFEAMKIEFDLTFNINASVSGLTIPVTINGTTTSWYAPGVGWVRSVDNSDFMGQAISTTIELTSYNVPE